MSEPLRQYSVSVEYTARSWGDEPQWYYDNVSAVDAESAEYLAEFEVEASGIATSILSVRVTEVGE